MFQMKLSPDNRTAKRKLGDIGENIACDYLRGLGFEILERNYLRKWGEIDIVAKKLGIIRFIEVKSVTGNVRRGVPHVTPYIRPEENLHAGKLRRLARAIQTYLAERKIVADFQLDLVAVYIDKNTMKARVEMIENVII